MSGGLVAIWARDPFLSAPLVVACERIGFAHAVVESAVALHAAAAGAQRVVLLIGPHVLVEEVEAAVALLPPDLFIAGIFFAAGTAPLDSPPSLPMQVHQLPFELRALVATIRALLGDDR